MVHPYTCSGGIARGTGCHLFIQLLNYICSRSKLTRISPNFSLSSHLFHITPNSKCKQRSAVCRQFEKHMRNSIWKLNNVGTAECKSIANLYAKTDWNGMRSVVETWKCHCCIGTCTVTAEYKYESMQCLKTNSLAHFTSIQCTRISHYDLSLMFLRKVNVVRAMFHKSDVCRWIMTWAWVKHRLRILRCNAVDCLSYEMDFLEKLYRKFGVRLTQSVWSLNQFCSSPKAKLIFVCFILSALHWNICLSYLHNDFSLANFNLMHDFSFVLIFQLYSEYVLLLHPDFRSHVITSVFCLKAIFKSTRLFADNNIVAWTIAHKVKMLSLPMDRKRCLNNTLRMWTRLCRYNMKRNQ